MTDLDTMGVAELVRVAGNHGIHVVREAWDGGRRVEWTVRCDPVAVAFPLLHSAVERRKAEIGRYLEGKR